MPKRRQPDELPPESRDWPETERRCTQCGEVKQLEAFSWSNGGRARRWSPRPACKECRNKAQKAVYHEDPEPIKARARAWYEKYPERQKSNSKRTAESNPERTRFYKKRWDAKNPEAKRAQTQLYRARKRGGETEKFKDMEIFDRDGWVCGICGDPIDRKLKKPHPERVSLDHKMPVAKGGSHTRDNVQAAHLRCNQRKSDQYDGDGVA